MHADWDARRPEFVRLVIIEKFTDSQLALHYAVTPTTIRAMRKRWKLRPNRAKPPRPGGCAAAGPYATYQEGDLTIKVYPPGYGTWQDGNHFFIED